jgi:mannosyltransferase OCH1-like enzyme
VVFLAFFTLDAECSLRFADHSPRRCSHSFTTDDLFRQKTMLSSRGCNVSRYWLAAISIFCIFYWILKAERHAFPAASTFKSKFYDEVSITSTHNDDSFAEDGLESFPQTQGTDLVPISKARPQSPSSLSDEFPKLLWQTSNAEGVERWANKSATWTEKNPTWDYNLLTG